MRTVCKVTGETEEVKKPIEFKLVIDSTNQLSECNAEPSEYKNVELISLGYTTEYDIIFAYHTERSSGSLYLGKWNDGIV